MIVPTSALAFLLAPLTTVTVVSNLDVCQGFITPTHHRIIPRTPSPLFYRDEEDTTISLAPEEIVKTLQGKPLLLPLNGTDVIDMAADTCSLDRGICGVQDTSTILQPFPQQVPKKMFSLRSITFEDHIEDFLDIAKPYYALDNEFAIVDDATDEVVGVVATAQVHMPLGRESGGIPFAEAGRHMGAAGSVAALLRNPQKKRFYYPVSQYHWDVHPYRGKIKEELSKINGGEQYASTARGTIIFARCTDFSKRTASCDVILENDDTTFDLVADFNIVPASLFQRKYPSLPDDALTTESDVNSLSSYESFGSLDNVKSFSDITGQWLCMEATLPPSKPSDCPGHFYDNTKALPHSVMLFHNGDLVGKAISEFTGLDLPFKRCDFGQEPGMRMLSWTCLPENLHFPDTYGLKLQSKVFLSKGELGMPGSTYTVQSEVKQEKTGVVCYKATGTFILEPVKFLNTEFRRAIGSQDFRLLWKKLDINGDGVVSRDELRQFVTSSGMAELDDKEFALLFDSIDEDNNGELSFEEVTDYFNSLHQDIKEDFGKSISSFLENGSPEEVTALWSKLDLNGDGVVTREELSMFIASNVGTDLDTQDTKTLHQVIDTNKDGVIDFSEFRELVYALKSCYDHVKYGCRQFLSINVHILCMVE